MYHDFGIDPVSPRLMVISHIHWSWTLPLGCLLALAVFWCSRRWSQKTNVLVAVAAIWIAVIIFGAFGLTVLTTTFGQCDRMVTWPAEQGP